MHLRAYGKSVKNTLNRGSLCHKDPCLALPVHVHNTVFVFLGYFNGNLLALSVKGRKSQNIFAQFKIFAFYFCRKSSVFVQATGSQQLIAQRHFNRAHSLGGAGYVQIPVADYLALAVPKG